MFKTRRIKSLSDRIFHYEKEITLYHWMYNEKQINGMQGLVESLRAKRDRLAAK